MDEEKGGKIAGALVAMGMLALWAPMALLDGWVMSKLWGWFMVPTFGLPPIGIAASIGVALIVVHTTHQGSSYYDIEKHGAEVVAGRVIGRGLFAPLWLLLTGWIVKGFMS